MIYLTVPGLTEEIVDQRPRHPAASRKPVARRPGSATWDICSGRTARSDRQRHTHPCHRHRQTRDRAGHAGAYERQAPHHTGSRSEQWGRARSPGGMQRERPHCSKRATRRKLTLGSTYGWMKAPEQVRRNRPFFPRKSRSAASFCINSANSFFSRAFSSSSDLSRRASNTSIPPNPFSLSSTSRQPKSGYQSLSVNRTSAVS